METDSIDAVIDAFESYGRIDHTIVARLMQRPSGAMASSSMVLYTTKLGIAITHAIRIQTTPGFAP